MIDENGFAPLDAALARIGQLCREDRALAGAFASKVRRLAPELADMLSKPIAATPLPMPGEPTAIAVTVYDNWPKGKPVKSKPHRYAVTVQAWTGPARKIQLPKPAWSANATLFTGAELAEKATALQSPKLRNPISADYAKTVSAAAQGLDGESGMVAGPLFKKGGETGTFYFEDHMVIAREDFTMVSLFVGAQPLIVDKFSRTYSTGKPLKGAAILQARISADPLLANWKTL